MLAVTESATGLLFATFIDLKNKNETMKKNCLNLHW